MSVRQITAGQDSFLDIVANLVGVLIILVVLVGAQARTAWQPATPVTNLDAEIDSAKSKLQAASDQVRKLEVDNQMLETEIVEAATYNVELANQRHQMLVQLKIVEQQLEQRKQQRREKLNEKQAAELDRLETKQQLLAQLAEIKAETSAVSAAASPTKSEIIKHYPNPIAKTVFAEEIHFQLKAGKLVYVPLEELVSRMKTEWRVKAEKLKQANRTVETVGPIENFRLQYELETETVRQPTQFGVMDRQAVRFDGFTIVPNSENIGQNVQESLSNGSEFFRILERHPPAKTTVSIWIYPDSYHAYNQLKTWLYEHNYQIACWPLDADKRISGGPNGFRSSAQ